MSDTKEKQSFDNNCWPSGDSEAPCQQACPIGTDTNGYIMAIYMGDYDEAYRIIAENNPLPGVCSRVCHRPCEDECLRDKVEEPVDIRALKRFAVENASQEAKNKLPETEKKKDQKVAIVGSGPAGIAAAQRLAVMGYGVTVFEKDSRLGGLLSTAIPSFILPDEVLSEDLKRIEAMGVEFKTNTDINGKEGVDRLFSEGFSAVLLAFGASDSTLLKEIDYSSEKIEPGLDFLRRMISNPDDKVSGKVAVIGGGNVATDVARMCVRRGAGEVNIYAIEEKDMMPAFTVEKSRSEKEGVKINGGWGFSDVKDEGGLLKITFSKVKEIKISETGAFTPILDNTETCEYEADNLILAVGQNVDRNSLKGLNINLTPKGTIPADNLVVQSIPGVFTAGDVIIYPGTVTESMASGQEAALAISAYLKGETTKPSAEKRPVRVVENILSVLPQKNRMEMPEIEANVAKGSFEEVESGFSGATAKEEASRCINCPRCGNCIMIKHQLCRDAATRLSVL